MFVVVAAAFLEVLGLQYTTRRGNLFFISLSLFLSVVSRDIYIMIIDR